MDPAAYDDFDDTIPLNGIPVSSPDAEWTGETRTESIPDAPVLSFREIEVPNRDFQPRLFRFGEAA